MERSGQETDTLPPLLWKEYPNTISHLLYYILFVNLVSSRVIIVDNLHVDNRDDNTNDERTKIHEGTLPLLRGQRIS